MSTRSTSICRIMTWSSWTRWLASRDLQTEKHTVLLNNNWVWSIKNSRIFKNKEIQPSNIQRREVHPSIIQIGNSITERDPLSSWMIDLTLIERRLNMSRWAQAEKENISNNNQIYQGTCNFMSLRSLASTDRAELDSQMIEWTITNLMLRARDHQWVLIKVTEDKRLTTQSKDTDQWSTDYQTRRGNHTKTWNVKRKKTHLLKKKTHIKNHISHRDTRDQATGNLSQTCMMIQDIQTMIDLQRELWRARDLVIGVIQEVEDPVQWLAEAVNLLQRLLHLQSKEDIHLQREWITFKISLIRNQLLTAREPILTRVELDVNLKMSARDLVLKIHGTKMRCTREVAEAVIREIETTDHQTLDTPITLVKEASTPETWIMAATTFENS